MPLATLLNANDPLFAFEHMMQHRQYFSVMQPLNSFSVLPYLLDPAQNTNQPAFPWNQNHQQAHNDFNRSLPENYSNGYTITVVTPPAATGLGTSTGTTSLVLTSVTNQIIVGSTITGAGVPAGTTITSQVSGTPGGAGTYTTSQPTTLTGIPLTIAHPPYQQANAILGNDFGIHAPGILLEGTSDDPWWTFVNHQQHFAANEAILPLPTQAPTTAGTGPGVANVSNPWWWVHIEPILFPYW